MANNQITIKPRYCPNPEKQENYTLFCHSHTVHTTVTAKPAVVCRWVYNIRHCHRFQLRRGRLVVGLGVQWAPGRDAVAATLQLCVGHNCLIFQLVHAAMCPAVLRRFLLDPDVIFVDVWNYRDAAMLAESCLHLRVRRLVELRDVASDLRGCSKSASMEELADEILGWDGLVKEGWVGRSDWDDAWLSDEQVKYAGVDAFVAFFMAKVLKIWKWVDDNDDDTDDEIIH